MTRHILDHQEAPADESELKKFVAIERGNGQSGPHPTSVELQRRTRSTSTEGRAQNYIRVDHGYTEST